MRFTIPSPEVKALQHRLQSAKKPITAGALVRVDFLGVVVQKVGGRHLIYFSAVQPVRTRCVLVRGNGVLVPARVRLEGFRLSRVGTYNFRNVEVDARGRSTVIRPYEDEERPEWSSEVEFLG